MPFWSWSKIFANNATADPNIVWSEGMAPSSVNDSARAVMGVLAQYRDDISGAILTTGTSTVYAVSSNQGFDTLAHLDGAVIAFTAHATNTGACTLNVDGTGAKPIRPSPSVDIPSGVLILGTPYVVMYNNTDGAFYLRNGISNPYNVPLAAGMDYWGSAAPNSAFAFPTGQAISRTTYAALYALLGNTFGGGDGSTTFNLPDKRGYVSAGVDAMGGTPANRLPGYSMNSQGGAQTVTVNQANLPAVNLPGNVTDPGHAHGLLGTTVPIQQAPPTEQAYVNRASVGISTQSATTGISVSTPLGGSNVPMNNLQPTIACNYIMRVA